ncbi:MAG TPA: hypothetical protein VFT82_04105 [Candidatus Paceibacterota bacterium]|nr:hypothetical protein [Candidatus Paceibacterota bacterium]
MNTSRKNANLESEIKRLDAQVAFRLKNVLRYIKEVSELLSTIGTETDRYQGSCHTKITQKLHDFHGFTFEGVFGMTQFGGNEIRIFYRQPTSYRGDGVVSFLVYWQDEDNLQVRTYDEVSGWDAALNLVLDDLQKHIKAWRKKLASDNEAVRQEVNLEQRLSGLKAKAKRLGIAVS